MKKFLQLIKTLKLQATTVSSVAKGSLGENSFGKEKTNETKRRVTLNMQGGGRHSFCMMEAFIS